MIKIDWNKFRLKNPNCRESFEDLCYHLFCRRFKQSEGIRADYNQVGLETHPIYDNKAKQNVGFQAKFFDNKLSDKSSIGQIKDSLKKAKANYPDLHRILIYTHQAFGTKNPKYKIEIESCISNIKIEWIVKSNFDVLLNNPQNYELAQFYFGQGDELGFIKNNCDITKMTLLSSSEYIPLKLIDDTSKTGKNIVQIIQNDSSKVTLILGNPGSGKSIIVHKLLQYFGGLDQKTKSQQKRVIAQNHAVPMVIDLKDCYELSLEELIRNRQSDYKLNNNSYSFIYLIDGLDEVSESKAEVCLSFLNSLMQNNTTKKIIISCRINSINRLKLRNSIPDTREYRIDKISDNTITTYFIKKKNNEKTIKLALLKTTNPKLLLDIKDILLVKILWDNVENISTDSAVIDLYRIAVDSLLNKPSHRKNLSHLNLLNPKEKAIIRICDSIAYKFQNIHQYRISLYDLQQMIIEVYPKLSYKHVNAISDYIITAFLDSQSTASQDSSYIFQHRRFQEYFFIRAIKQKYEEHPKVLREYNLLTNPDGLLDLAYQYFHNEFSRESNLPMMLELNTFDLYLRTDTEYSPLRDSKSLLPALISQNDLVFEKLISNEITNISDIISPTPYNVSSLHKAGKVNHAIQLNKELTTLIRSHEKKHNDKEYDHSELDDMIYEQWEDVIYIRCIFENIRAIDVLHSLVRGNYKRVSKDEEFYQHSLTKRSLIKPYFRVCLQYRLTEILNILDQFDNYELITLLEVLLEPKYVKCLIENPRFFMYFDKLIVDDITNIDFQNEILLVYKKFRNKKLVKQESDYLDEKRKKIHDNNRYLWGHSKDYNRFAQLSYAIDFFPFEILISKSLPHMDIFNEPMCYSALYIELVQILNKTRKIGDTIRIFISYLKKYNRLLYPSIVLEKEIVSLIVTIFKVSIELGQLDVDKIPKYTKLLLEYLPDFKELNFFKELKMQCLIDVNKICNENNLQEYIDELDNWKDYYNEFAERCFDLAYIFSTLNENISMSLILRGVNESILRHGWRKDTIVSYDLVKALDIIWAINLYKKERLIEYATLIFDLSIRVTEITDGKGTKQGPYNIISVACKYDIDFADNLIKKLTKVKGSVWNSAITDLLLAKIEIGEDLESIEQQTNRFNIHYGGDSKPKSDYFEEKVRVFVAIAESDLYDVKDKELAFSKAYSVVENAIKRNIKHMFLDTEFNGLKISYQNMCKTYKLDYNIEEPLKDEYQIKETMTESQFIKKLLNVKSAKSLEELYNKLENYNETIILHEPNSWNVLVNQTYKVCNNLDLLFKLFNESHFLRWDNMTHNSKFMHFGLAHALQNIYTRNETLQFIYRHSGHEGFVQTLKAFDYLGDRETCRKLFEQFVRFCIFIVY